VCVCSLSYPACNAHAPYCHLWPVPLYNIFTHYLIKGMIFGKKSSWAQNVFFWVLLTHLSETFLILRRVERDMIMCSGVQVQDPLFLSTLNVTWIFSKAFRKKNSQISNVMIIRQMGDEYFYAEGRTDMTKPIVAVRNFFRTGLKTNRIFPQLLRGFPCHYANTAPCSYTPIVHRKISSPPGFNPWTLRPVASCYTDWDIPSHGLLNASLNKSLIIQGYS